MADFLLLMHDDALSEDDVRLGGLIWPGWKLRACYAGAAPSAAAYARARMARRPRLRAHLTGFIRIEARDLRHAQSLLAGNPTYDAGGTVEIRELPHTD